MKKQIKQLYHLLLAHLGAVIYRNPSRKLFVLGVTGTKGKSSVIELINAGLEAAGEKTAISSSLRFKVGPKALPNRTNNTMPGRFFLQKFLNEAMLSGCKYALIEVTSEGISQYRHHFIDFDAAAIINLHPEHIESHGSFERYREAKLTFFRDVKDSSQKKRKYFFINKDDPNAKYFIDAVSPEKVILFGKSKLKTNLPGEINKYNVGLSESFLKTQGIKSAIIKRALGEFPGIPGRLEFVLRKPISVIVDYAHTPVSLEAVYKTLKKAKRSTYKMICVLGSCGGGRDRWKRPKFGEIASEYCDRIILTNEDPYDEDPAQILREIKSGIQADKIRATEEILERGGAIKRAVELAKKGDLVVITGKGSEPYIHLKGGHRIPWSDKEVVLGATRNLAKQKLYN